jgi:hypothetical protein
MSSVAIAVFILRREAVHHDATSQDDEPKDQGIEGNSVAVFEGFSSLDRIAPVAAALGWRSGRRLQGCEHLTTGEELK